MIGRGVLLSHFCRLCYAHVWPGNTPQPCISGLLVCVSSRGVLPSRALSVESVVVASWWSDASRRPRNTPQPHIWLVSCASGRGVLPSQTPFVSHLACRQGVLPSHFAPGSCCASGRGVLPSRAAQVVCCKLLTRWMARYIH